MPHNMYLPLPTPYHDYSGRDLPASHTSTPVAHKIITDKPSGSISGQKNYGLAWVTGPTALPRLPIAYGNDVEMQKGMSMETAAASPIPRKRAASILPPSEAARHERAASTSSSKSSSSGDSIPFCLCKPAQKIPRPSNCLYIPFPLLFLLNGHSVKSMANCGKLGY